MELHIELHYEKHYQETRQYDCKRSCQGAEACCELPGAGFLQYFVTDIGRTVQSYRPRCHLGYCDYVRECALGNPGSGSYYFTLDDSQHGIASAEREHPDEEEYLE